MLLLYLMQYTFISNGFQMLALPQEIMKKLRKFLRRLCACEEKSFAVLSFCRM